MPHAEVGANFPLQPSSQTQFVKIKKKRVIAKNQFEKRKILRFLLAFSVCPPILNHKLSQYPLVKYDVHRTCIFAKTDLSTMNSPYTLY